LALLTLIINLKMTISILNHLKLINFKFFFHLFLFSFFVANVQAQQVVSPDGKLTVNLAVTNGTPTYSVSYKGKLFLEPSPIGLKTNIGDFSTGLELKANQVQNKIDETYELPNIKQSKVHYVANETVFSFSKDNKAVIDIIFRVSNNDVAFKYKVYPQ